MDVCKKCGQPILWIVTKQGKSMPCDPKQVFFLDGGGTSTFVTPDGETKRGRRAPDGPRMGYISHFATCPHAADFRRERKGRA